MKPPLNSLDPDFYLDRHEIAHTHKYQSSKQAWYFSPKIHEWFSDKFGKMSQYCIKQSVNKTLGNAPWLGFAPKFYGFNGKTIKSRQKQNFLGEGKNKWPRHIQSLQLCETLHVYFSLLIFVVLCVSSSANSRCPSPASSPHPACRSSSGAPCCTCQTARWARIAPPPRPTASTAVPPRFTTSSPPRARRTGGPWTSRVPTQTWGPHLIPSQTAAQGRLSLGRWVRAVVCCVSCLWGLSVLC